MQATIRFSEKFGKFEGLIGKKVVTRRNAKRAVEDVLRNRYNVTNFSTVEADAPVIKSTANSEFHINERFQFLEHFTRMVAKRKATSLVVSGPGGLGKTHTVMETLKACGLKEDTIGEIDGDFIVIKGFTTAKGMYRSLWENNGKVIVFDDADSSFKDPIGCNILKGALDSGEKRVISWNAEFSEREELPNRFEFTGRVIFISNMPMDKIPQAIQSRALRVSLDMTTNEKVERIETIMYQNNFMPNIDREVKDAVVRFMKKFAGEFTDLNMRSAINITQLRDSMDDDSMFEKMARYMAKA